MNHEIKHDLKLLGIGKRLSDAIKNSYYTQSTIADKCSISRALISLYCSGKRLPSPDTLRKICIILDCSPDWILKGIGEVNDKFDFSRFSTEFKRIKASRSGDIIEISFSIPSKEFNGFISEVLLDGLIQV